MLSSKFGIFFNFLVDLREGRNNIPGYFNGEEKDSVVSFSNFLLQKKNITLKWFQLWEGAVNIKFMKHTHENIHDYE